MKIHRVLGDVRWMGPLAAALVILVALQGKWLLGQRAESARTGSRIADTRLEIESLSARLEEERAERERLGTQRPGRGPGGIVSAWDGDLFEGPTAARSALELALAADEVGYHLLRYEDLGVKRVASFPRDGGDDTMMMEDEAAAPLRDRYGFMEWPVRLYVESDYPSILRLIERLTFSTPSFSVHGWQVNALRDEQGAFRDRLSFEATLSTFWLAREGG